MSSKYEMWLTHDGGSKKVRLPVLPDTVTITNGSRNRSIDIVGLGEIVIKQDRPALVLSFSSFFPGVNFSGTQGSSVGTPSTLKDSIVNFKNSDKPVQFLITGAGINLYCSIENFSYHERGGDVGTLYYNISLKEYREVSVRQVKVNVQTSKASLPPSTTTRVDNTVKPKTYTVKKGDCLWNIAARFLGSGSKYKQIYNLNRNIIKNPNLIYPGQVLKLP